MRTITRNPNPPACLAQQPAAQDWRAFMGTPCHQQVGDSLREEQHHVCCYCEVEIQPTDCHIEHMVPRSVRQGHDYDYNNLAVSCDGGSVEHCGRFKDDRHQNQRYQYDPALFCRPHDHNTASLFWYLTNGKVVPSPHLNAQDKQKAEYMIGYLGLNCSRLVYRRREHARGLVATIGDPPLLNMVTWAVGYYLNPENGKLRQFVSLSRKILNQ
jgi:uncharacterized protein (TIGR02646 family)